MSTLSLLLLAACAGSDPKAESCGVSVTGTLPASDLYYRDPFGFTLSAADPTATITTSVAGHQEVSEDGLTVWWIPAAPLAPLTSYDATLTTCDGATDATFTTTALGLPLEDRDALLGRVYDVALPDAHIVQPEGLGGILGPMLAVVLAEVVSVSATDLDVLGAVAVTGSDPAVEDWCTPTIDFPPGAFDEQPFFHLGPTNVDLVVAGSIVTVGDLELSGTFAADGSSFGGGVFTGLVDTRPLSLVENPEGDGSDLCNVVAGLGIECEVCPTDSQPYCLSILADQIEAQAVAAEVGEVLGYNCDGCEAGPPEPDAECEG
jgi:hypothetical protein